MGWWGIVLIQQTNVAEAELPFWRRGKELFPESRLSYNRSWGRCVGPVVIFFSKRSGRPHSFEVFARKYLSV